MAGRSYQCQECTDTFEAGPRGPLPHTCPSCKKGEKERPKAARRTGPTRAASTNGTSPAIESAKSALRGEIETLEGQLATRREALDALEALA